MKNRMGIEMENLSEINECVRLNIINLETTRTKAKELRVKSKAEGRLKERLDEMLSTALADLLILSDFISDAENCIDDNDLELLLEVTQDETVN